MWLIATCAVLLPALIAAVGCRFMIVLAPRLGLVDVPDERKAHTRAVPLGGGVPIHLAVIATLTAVVVCGWLVVRFPALAAWAPAVVVEHAPGVLSTVWILVRILLAATLQMLLGLIDDRRGLSYQLRLAVEVGLVAWLLTQGIGVTVFLGQTWLTAPLTVLWVVGLTNAINFLDNTDGLAGGVVLIASTFFALIALLIGNLFVAGCFLILAGSLLGFLPFNWSPARLFMGDAGSNFLGFWLGVLTVVATFHTPQFHHITLLAPLCVLAIPLYDSVTVIGLRLKQGRSPFRPDRQHLSHRLIALGFTPVRAVLCIFLMTLATGLSGVVLYFVPRWAGVLVLSQVASLLGIVGLLEYTARGGPAAGKPDSRP